MCQTEKIWKEDKTILASITFLLVGQKVLKIKISRAEVMAPEGNEIESNFSRKKKFPWGGGGDTRDQERYSNWNFKLSKDRKAENVVTWQTKELYLLEMSLRLESPGLKSGLQWTCQVLSTAQRNQIQHYLASFCELHYFSSPLIKNLKVS